MSDKKTNPQLLFVGGAPRSGTTLVQKMLNSHSVIYGGPEFDRLGDIVHLRNLLQYSNERGRSKAYYNSSELDSKVANFILDLLSKPAAESNAHIISEKTPSNIFHLDQILGIDKSAKAIIVIRDPKAIVASMKNVKDKAISAGEPIPDFTKSVSNSISFIEKYWKEGLKAYNNYGDRVHLVLYEELIRESKRELEAICSFLNIEFEIGMTSPGESGFNRGNEKDNIWYTDKDHKRNIDEKSLYKWKEILSTKEVNEIDSKLTALHKIWLHGGVIKEERELGSILESSNKLRTKIISYLRNKEGVRGQLARLVKDSYKSGNS
ncbi:sulfotransferase family protein [Gelidibacter japonicus]|uniref:sulfotransferase family protein n=1 Tax=Gelidibacter japonicus TaxID=1962232 RepID=UPI003A958C81